MVEPGAAPTMGEWIDETIRPQGDPEVDVNPLTGEFEYSWTLGNGGRFTVLLPRDVADRTSSKVRELLMVLPILALALIS